MINAKDEIKKPAGLNRKQRRSLEKNLVKLLPKSTISISEKSKITEMDIIKDVFSASVCKTSVEEIASKTDHSPDRVIANLNQLSIEKIEEVMIKNAEKVALQLRKTRRVKFAVAFDFTDVMYYGDKDNNFVVGTKPKNGTCWSFRFFVVNITTEGARSLLYACPLTKETNGAMTHVEAGIEILQKLKLNFYVLTMDKEFYSADVINYLQEKNVHLLMPAVQNSKFLGEVEKIKFPEKLPVVLMNWRIGQPFVNETETTLVILEEKDRKTEEMHVFGYITNLPIEFYEKDVSVLSELYSKRWGIETAFRVQDKFDIYTTSTKGNVRYFFFVISCLLYNFWVFVNLCIQIPEFERGEFRVIIKVDKLKIFFTIFLLKDDIMKDQKIADLLLSAMEERQKLWLFCHISFTVELERSFTSKELMRIFS
jgi:putative transposase